MLENQRTSAEIDKLTAERNKLHAEADYYRNAHWFSLAQNTIAFIAILIPVIIAIRQIGAQKTAQQDRAQTEIELLSLKAKVDASLKAAEIAMNAPTTGQVRARAEILSALLQDLVPDFGNKLKDLDYSRIGFASYRARFLSLLEAVSSHPENAAFIVDVFEKLFPEDDKNSHGRIEALSQHLRDHH